MRWHLGGSADVFAVVKTHSFVQGTVGRKLPAGISSDDKSLTREKEEGDRCGKRRAIWASRETQMSSTQCPEEAKGSHDAERAVFRN